MKRKATTLRPDLEAKELAGKRFYEAFGIGRAYAWVKRIAKARPLRVIADPAAQFRHPWNTRLRFGKLETGKEPRWHFQINPGMVGEKDPYRWREIEGKREKAFIDDDPLPWFPIEPDRLRKIGTDADPGSVEPVPEYFALRDVVPPPKLKTDGEELEIELRGGTSKKRLLRACDLVLTQPRTAISAALDAEGSIDFSFYTPDPDPFINLYPKWEEPIDEVPIVQQLIGGFTDRAFEELHLATIYLLSTSGEAAGSDPDGSWTPFVAHKVFWNLGYRNNSLLSLALPDRFPRPITGLAGGVADLLIGNITDELQRHYSLGLSLLNQSKIRGWFWTQ